MSKSAREDRREQDRARVRQGLADATRIVERALFDDNTGPSPMAFAIAAYGAFRSNGTSSTEITAVFRDMPRLLGEVPEPAGLAAMEQNARDLGAYISTTIGDGAVFTLVVANVGEGGHMTYLSNGNRNDCIGMLKELVEKLEAEQATKL